MSGHIRYAVLKGISNLLCRCSYDRILSIGAFFGPLVMNRIGKQKRRGLEQIKMGLRCGDDEAERILQRVYRNIGMSVMEMLYMPRLVREKITSMIMCASSIQNIWKRPMRKGKELSALRRISATGNGWARGSLCTATPRRRSAKTG